MKHIGALPELPLADELSRRLTFRKRRATQSLILTILLWYVLQIATLYLGWTVEQWQWLFTTESFPALSPGLVFAIISHDLPPNVTHLLGNIAFLWLFAGESEQHMSGIEVLWFFVVAALVAVTVSSAVTGQSTLGASGGALAFVGFYSTHLCLVHRSSLDLDVGDYNWGEPAALRAYWQVALLLLPIGFIMFMLGQSIGFFPVGRTDVVGHLVGSLLGAGYAVIRSQCGGK
ncbi:rhomboid family intramembrane serine protease [Haloarcula sp. AONF1]